MPPVSSGPRTTGAAEFDPDALIAKAKESIGLENDDFRSSIISFFNLPHNDSYVYHAIASVTLSQVQEAINHGNGAGLHAWYRDDEGNPLPPPSQADITAYTAIFSPSSSPSKLLTAFASNAKKSSIRSRVASHLQSHRLSLPTPLSTIPKSKTHINPALDFWRWSCHNLEWCGPEERTAEVQTSHHILPVFMHHFGCVVPSYESLEIIKRIAGTRAVLDIGSGNGYWTYMLRRQGVIVHAVDNLQSTWRTIWIGDTIIKDGERYLKDSAGAKDAVLLLVYPIVGADFMRKTIDAYKGRTIIVVGTQNKSGYTGFKDRTVEEWMATEKEGWSKTVQIPLPSFAGKDEALFVFEMGE